MERFKELALMIVVAGKSEICTTKPVGWKPRQDF